MRNVRDRPRISTPSGFQEKGCWEMRWAQVARKEQSTRPATTQGREEAQVGEADVLRLVRYGEIENYVFYSSRSPWPVS
jgi:hypothetical protein